MKQIRFMVSGGVHGVNHRSSSAKKAKDLGLRGFIRNTRMGVEVLVEGKEKGINEFLLFCQNNPGHSNVKNLEIKEEKEISCFSFNTFEIRYF